MAAILNRSSRMDQDDALSDAAPEPLPSQPDDGLEDAYVVDDADAVDESSAKC